MNRCGSILKSPLTLCKFMTRIWDLTQFEFLQCERCWEARALWYPVKSWPQWPLSLLTPPSLPPVSGPPPLRRVTTHCSASPSPCILKLICVLAPSRVICANLRLYLWKAVVLKVWFPWTSSIRIIWKLDRNGDSWVNLTSDWVNRKLQEWAQHSEF